MKTNLKTFPKPIDYSRTPQDESLFRLRIIIKWKEDFEKELRHKRENWSANNWLAVDNPHISIAELLGE